MKRETINKRFRAAALTAAVAVLAVASTSCSKDTEQEPGTGAADGAIRITSQIAASRQSRGVTLDNMVLANVILLRTDATTATTPSSFFASTRITASRQADGKLTDFSPVPYYKTNNNYAHFVAFHPAAGSYSPSVENWTLNGGNDLLLTETPWCAGRYSAPVTTGMTFEHQLAQLQVICKPDPKAELALVTEAWGEITNIDLLETAAKATFDCATRTMSFTEPVTMALRKTDCETVFAPVTLAANTTTPCAGGMYAPDVSGTLPLKLKIYTATSPDGVPVEVQLKSNTNDKGFAKGMTHTVTLTFGITNKQIAVSASSVDAWVEGGTGDSGTIASPAQVGDYYYSDDTWSTELRYDKKVVGVIFWVAPAVPGYVKVVSLSGPPASWGGLTNANEMLPWSKTSIDVGGSYPAIRATSSDALTAPARQSGAVNRAVLQQYLDNNTKGHTIGDFPAFGWCDAMNTDGQTGWVLPSINEMQELYCGSRAAPASYWTSTAPTLGSNTAFSARLIAAGGIQVGYNASYRTSTESSATQIWSINMALGPASTNENKTLAVYIRCIKTPSLKPSAGVLDWNNPTVVKSGSLNGTAFTAVSSTNSYNGYTNDASNAANNGGYKSPAAAALAEPVYYKLEIAKADETAAPGTTGWSTDGTATWPTAWAACKAKAPAGAWRLPRASELAWMYLNKTELAKIPGFTALAASYYCSSTEYDSTDSWAVGFPSGGTNYGYKTANRTVRCVREIF